MERHPLTLLSLAAFVAASAAAAAVCYRRPAWAIALLIAADPFLFSQSVWRTTITLPKAVLAGIFLGLLARRVDWRPLLSSQVRPLSYRGACDCGRDRALRDSGRIHRRGRARNA